MRRDLITTAVVRAIPMSPFALVSVVAGASDIRFPDYLMETAIGIMVPVILLTVATDQTFRLLTEPTPALLLNPQEPQPRQCPSPMRHNAGEDPVTIITAVLLQCHHGEIPRGRHGN